MLKVISLYTGVGGLDFGFEAAGFEGVVAVEMDATACRTMRNNRRWSVIEGDIHKVSSRAILKAGGLKKGEADVLIAGPPCQPFSKSSYWVNGDTLRLDDPRAGTLGEFLRVLRDTRPRAFLLENVYGLAYKGKDEGLQFLLEGIRQINRDSKTNYSVTTKMLNSANYGVPQIRERVFLIGSRDGTLFRFPEKTHALEQERAESSTRFEPCTTAWDALGDLPKKPKEDGLAVGGRWANLLPTIPEGENYLFHTRRGGGQPLFGWRTRYWSFLLKLSKRKPSWTIQAQPGSAIGPFHWANRKLSNTELCRLQTFPDGLVFDCGRTEVQKMLGNAVPSLLAEVLAREIRAQLLGHVEARRRQLRLLPRRREKVPPPEHPAPLPTEYVSLIGNHPDHAGERNRSNRKENVAQDSRRAVERLLFA